MLVVSAIEDLEARLGQELGVSRWHRVGDGVSGFDALALAPTLMDEVLSLKGLGPVVNYGLNRVRFPASSTACEEVRLRLSLEGISSGPGSRDVTLLLTFECAGQRKPVCVAESVLRVVDLR